MPQKGPFLRRRRAFNHALFQGMDEILDEGNRLGLIDDIDEKGAHNRHDHEGLAAHAILFLDCRHIDDG